jgi:hypothetical protein
MSEPPIGFESADGRLGRWRRRLRGGVGDYDSWQGGVGAVKDCHVAYPVDERAGGALGEVGEEGVAGRAIAATRGFYLDEFVVVQRTGGFRRDGVREAGVSEADQGLQVVSQAAEVAALLFGEVGGYRRGRWGCGGLAWYALLAGLGSDAAGTDAFGLVEAASPRRARARGSGRPGAAGWDVFLDHGPIVNAEAEL